MARYILTLDEGTTSARAILFDSSLQVKSVAQHEFPQIYPKAGWVEQDPLEIYASQYAALTECVAKSNISPSEIQLSVSRISVKRLSCGRKARASRFITQ